jgi:hypothetical protein
MIIPVRTIIKEITNALNKSEFKIGDIVYEIYDFGGQDISEYKIKILRNFFGRIEILILGNSFIRDDKVITVELNKEERFHDDFDLDELSSTHYLSRVPKIYGL